MNKNGGRSWTMFARSKHERMFSMRSVGGGARMHRITEPPTRGFSKTGRILFSYNSITNGMPVAAIPTVKHYESRFINAKFP